MKFLSSFLLVLLISMVGACVVGHVYIRGVEDGSAVCSPKAWRKL